MVNKVEYAHGRVKGAGQGELQCHVFVLEVFSIQGPREFRVWGN